MCLTPAHHEQTKKSKEINEILKQEKKKEENVIKLLLLGSGESGKSTFVKQMKILHLNGFSDEERKSYKYNVIINIMQNMVSLLEATQRNSTPISSEMKEAAEFVFSMDASQEFNETTIIKLTDSCKALWKDPSIQEAYNRSSEFQINDSALYFFNRLDQIAEPKYVPNVQDILRIRSKTSGVAEQKFQINNNIFNIIDVGGQRSERRKWIHCFNDVTSIIFFVSLSEYDQRLSEDETTNRMSESFKLFKDITNYKSFQMDMPIILFLNKADLFKAKIEKIPLNIYFKEYTGKNEFDEARKYIEKSLFELAPKGRQIFCHTTIATDTDNIDLVFKIVKEIIITSHLRGIGMGI